MNRGDIVLILGKSGAITKARPCVVVQRSSSLADSTKITACPLSSSPSTDPLFRPIVPPSEQNGLRRLSQIEVDWIFTECIERFGPRIGSLDAAMLERVSESLRLWLDL